MLVTINLDAKEEEFVQQLAVAIIQVEYMEAREILEVFRITVQVGSIVFRFTQKWAVIWVNSPWHRVLSVP
ncbi:hypothetical protein PTI98_007491 [Pleurotus ostreatus]|nr:hypothetical protein PTI98_007491 [Pleurotus ostreatus]